MYKQCMHVLHYQNPVLRIQIYPKSEGTTHHQSILLTCFISLQTSVSNTYSNMYEGINQDTSLAGELAYSLLSNSSKQ